MTLMHAVPSRTDGAANDSDDGPVKIRPPRLEHGDGEAMWRLARESGVLSSACKNVLTSSTARSASVPRRARAPRSRSLHRAGRTAATRRRAEEERRLGARSEAIPSAVCPDPFASEPLQIPFAASRLPGV